MRSLVLSFPLLLTSLAMPLLLISPAEAQVIGPCCVGDGKMKPPDPRHPQPIFVPAEVKRADERTLEATAEAPTTVEVPLADAIGVPLNELPELPRPVRERVPIIAEEGSGPIVGVDDHGSGSISLPGCCRVEAIEPEDPPKILVGAKVQNPDERALEAAAEAKFEKAIQVINAIGIPLYPVDEDRRGVSEPEREPAIAGKGPTFDKMPDCCVTTPDRERQSPVTVDAPWSWLDALRANAEVIVLVLVIVVAIGFALPRRRQRKPLLELEPFPWPRPLPDELPQPDAAPVPLFEPEVIEAKARQAEREPA